jgi:hypothetical protein
LSSRHTFSDLCEDGDRGGATEPALGEAGGELRHDLDQRVKDATQGHLAVGDKCRKQPDSRLQMRVLDQSRSDVVDERVERVRRGPSPDSRRGVAGQVLADRFAVMAGRNGRHPSAYRRVAGVPSVCPLN